MARKRKKQVVCPECKSPLKEISDSNGQPDLVCMNEACKFSTVCKISRND